MSRFVAVPLDQLPPPDAVVVPDYEALLATRKARIMARVEALSGDAELIAELRAVLYGSELEPLVVDQEVSAEREVIVYQRINDAVRAVLLASSQGADLDQLVARLDVMRLTAPANLSADPPIPAYRESDAALRERYQLALEAFSTAGPYGAYHFHARSAHPHVKHTAVYGPESEIVDPGHVRVVVLSHVGNGVPSEQVLASVRAKLSPDDARPLTDFVEVTAATVATYSIDYHLEIAAGADPLLVVGAAETALAAYAAARHRVGAVVADSGLDAAAHQPGVERATRSSPEGEVDPGPLGAALCTGITITWEIVDG